MKLLLNKGDVHHHQLVVQRAGPITVVHDTSPLMSVLMGDVSESDFNQTFFNSCSILKTTFEVISI